LEIHPVAILTSAQNAGVNKGGELALEARRANSQVLGEVTEVPPPLGMEQGRSQERLAYPRKEGIEGSFFTHIA
jgi:hypothetical protein